jgi:hypothetical protein
MKQFQDLDQAFSSRAVPEGTVANRPIVPVYRVGEPFRPGFRTWPEGADYAYGPDGGHELTLFCPEIDEDIVNEVRQGQAEFALIVQLPLIVLAYRFGSSIPWNDVSYAWHLQPGWRRVIPEIDDAPEHRSLLWISLVGANDGIVHAQRGMTLSPGFTRTLNHAVRAQAMRPFDPTECTAAIARLFLEYPTTADRLTVAAVQTMGNA